MKVFIVLFHGSLVGAYSCAVDAAVAAKGLPPSTVVACQLNSETSSGALLLARCDMTLSKKTEYNAVHPKMPACEDDLCTQVMLLVRII